MPARHEYTRIVQWGDCDPANIIFFAVYARWIADGFDHLMRAAGIPHGAATRPGFRLGFPAVSTHLEYKAPAKLYDEVLHRVEVAAIGRKSLTLAHTILRGDTVLMQASETRVMAEFSPETGAFKSIEIPPEIRTKLED